MRKSEVIEAGNHLLKLFIDLWGLSPYYDYPPRLYFFKIDSFEEDGIEYPTDGEFRFDGTIVINHQRMWSKRKLIRTLLHEWKHYMQSPTWHTRYSNTFDYTDNPYEIEANEFEKWWVLFKDLI